MGSGRGWAVAAVCGLVGVVAPTVSPVDAPLVAAARQDDDIGRVHGQAAIDRLGPAIAQLASRMGTSVRDVVRQFLSDPSLQVDSQGRALYVDPPAPSVAPAHDGSPSASIGIDPSDAFALHSLPGASRVIYLDFDGHLLTGTRWNSYTGGDCWTGPYDSDGDPGTFSDAERAAIIGIWARVAEDYRPFAVDVTTEDPGADAIRRTSTADTNFGARALVTYSTTACPNGKTLYATLCSNGCGGIAYLSVFDYASSSAPDYYQPALVFQNGTRAVEKYVAEAASHEVGHNLGLSHDQTQSDPYYEGHGAWAPIMGVGYYRAITQWSKGEFTGSIISQDDLAVMASRGAPFRPDDHGNTIGDATTLSVGTPATGVIGTRADHDAFAFSVTEAGQLSITASPWDRSPNLDLAVSVQDATGAVVATANPPSGAVNGDLATGLDATLSIDVVAGTYTVIVDGVGVGSPLTTGYSDYASLGAYSLTTTFEPVAPSTSTTTTTTTTTTSTTTTTTVAPTTTTTVPANLIDVATATVTGTRSGNKITATATVTVRNTSLTAVGGAKVTGTWTVAGKVIRTSSATTDGAGVARLSLGKTNATSGALVQFCVTAVTKSGMVYTPSLFAAGQCAAWTAP